MLFWAGVGVGRQAPRDVDGHSYANPEHVRVRHVDLDLAVAFVLQMPPPLL